MSTVCVLVLHLKYNEVTRLFWADIDDPLELGLNGDLVAARQVLAED